MRRASEPFILAVSPSPRGFAFVLFRGANQPFDWGVKRIAGEGKNFRVIQAVAAILRDYHPEVVVIEDVIGRTRRGLRIRALLHALTVFATKKGVRVVRINRNDLRATFASEEAHTRPEIAAAIAKRIPAFAHRIPPLRKIWESEDPRQNLFDAAALGLAFYRRGAAPDRPAFQETLPGI